MALTKAERSFRDDMAAYGLKFCTGCKLFLPVGMFQRNKRSRDGLRDQCAGCKSAYAESFRKENLAQLRERSARYYRDNREKVLASHARYRTANREMVLAGHARYRAENREKVREGIARWRAENPDKRRAEYARYRAAHPDKNRAKARRRRAMKARVFRAAYDESAILARNGGRCIYCDAEPATALDHFVPLSWGSDDAPWNLVGACGPCNSSKCDADPYEWLESRGVDVDAWERRHIAGWFDLPRKLWRIQRVYRPPVG